MIAVVDYGMGNISSIQNMFKRIGYRDVVLTRKERDLESAEKIILPGVGAFDQGMKNLHASGLVPILNEIALVKKKPVLGICLGFQLMTRRSEEGSENGLGWIKADTVKFRFPENSQMKVPHMGWNYISVKPNCRLLDIKEQHKFYFVHSYYVRCDNPDDVMGTCNYGTSFDCYVESGNIFGVQFHPEKSHRFGMRLLENFVKS